MTMAAQEHGLNKKIVNPVDEKFKTLLEFYHILKGNGTLPLKEWLKVKNWSQQHIGLVNIAHAQNLYAVYHDDQGAYQGIIKKDHATDVLLSSVPKTAPLKGYLLFNKDGYSAYCKNYHAY